MKHRKASGVYGFLKASGVLEHGTAEDIAAARKLYWKRYRVTWRKQKRKEQKAFTISFSENELEVITTAAQKHHRSSSRYIKESALAYAHKRYLITNPEAINHIRELLSLNITALETISESYSDVHTIKDRMATLEQELLITLYQPKDLEASIRETVQNDPSYKTKLLKLLQTM